MWFFTINYRKQEKSYGDCIYIVLRDYLFNSYSCYPPWFEASEEKQCETDVPMEDFKEKVRDQIWNDIYSFASGIELDLMKQCLPPCYQVKLTWEETFSTTSNKYAFLDIFDNVESIRTKKAVYSFDIFMLMVELGSALGLWLGMYS